MSRRISVNECHGWNENIVDQMIQKSLSKNARPNQSSMLRTPKPSLGRQEQAAKRHDLFGPKTKAIPVLGFLAIAKDPAFRAARHHSVNGQDAIPDRERRITRGRNRRHQIKGAYEVRLEHAPATRQVPRLCVARSIKSAAHSAAMFEINTEPRGASDPNRQARASRRICGMSSRLAFILSGSSCHRADSPYRATYQLSERRLPVCHSRRNRV